MILTKLCVSPIPGCLARSPTGSSTGYQQTVSRKNDEKRNCREVSWCVVFPTIPSSSEQQYFLIPRHDWQKRGVA
eukprot:scaffold823_cov219-Amphora_coffeaeformis.AAC.2